MNDYFHRIESMKSIILFFSRFLPKQKVYAHCDVPCGIYDPRAAQLGAKTVLTMIQKMKALKKEGDDDIAKLTFKNNLTRMIVTKEQHAEICKREILILWTD